MVEDEDVDKYISSAVKKTLKDMGYEKSSPLNVTDDLPVGQMKDFKTAISMVKELGEATRGDLDKIVADGVKQKIAENIVPVLFGGQKPTSFWDSGFMQQLGRGLGEKAPEYTGPIIETVVKIWGKDGAEGVIDKLGSLGLGGGSNRGAKSGNGGSGVGGVGGGGNDGGANKDDELISSLDPDNPSHLHYYMSIRNMGSVDQSVARKSLVNEKNDLMKRSGGVGSGGRVQSDNKEEVRGEYNDNIIKALETQNSFIKSILQRQQKNDEIMKFLVEKIQSIESGDKGLQRDVVGDIARDDVVDKVELKKETDGEIVDRLKSQWEEKKDEDEVNAVKEVKDMEVGIVNKGDSFDVVKDIKDVEAEIVNKGDSVSVIKEEVVDIGIKDDISEAVMGLKKKGYPVFESEDNKI